MHTLGWERSVTVRVTTLKGPSAGVCYVGQLPSYYLQADEPRGVWLGQLDSRPAKPKALDAQVQHRRWAEQTSALGLVPAEIIEAALGRVQPGVGIDRATAAVVIDRAIATIAEGQSTW